MSILVNNNPQIYLIPFRQLCACHQMAAIVNAHTRDALGHPDRTPKTNPAVLAHQAIQYTDALLSALGAPLAPARESERDGFDEIQLRDRFDLRDPNDQEQGR